VGSRIKKIGIVLASFAQFFTFGGLVVFLIIFLMANQSSILYYLFLSVVILIPYIGSSVSKLKRKLINENVFETHVCLDPKDARRLPGCDKSSVSICYLLPRNWRGIGNSLFYNLVTLGQVTLFSLALAFPFSRFFSNPQDVLTPLFPIVVTFSRAFLRVKEEMGLRLSLIVALTFGILFFSCFLPIIFQSITSILEGRPLHYVMVEATQTSAGLLWLFSIATIMSDTFTALRFRESSKH